MVFEKNGTFEIDLKDIVNDGNFCIKEGTELVLDIKNFAKENSYNFFVNNNAKLVVRVINDGVEKSFSFHGCLGENSSLNIYFADLSKVNTKINSHIILEGNYSKSIFKISSVANKGIFKDYHINFDHLGEHTDSLLEGYGVSLKDGEIDIKGISHIEVNSIKSKAIQKAKVILFDKESKAKASPTLRIDCDDIQATHACAIGNLNQDHIFYLESRGLSEDESRNLITYGYLMPIQEYFDENGKKLINDYVKENF
ncbi:MAG: SufD family Fe-S cluster assembly protein [Bacilli bacterium]